MAAIRREAEGRSPLRLFAFDGHLFGAAGGTVRIPLADADDFGPALC
jgi:hypothetical protein